MDDRKPDDTPLPPDERPRAAPAETPTRAPRKSHLGLKLLGLFVLVPLVALGAWMAVTLHWVYSEGSRSGYVQKFSQKGWICKTWEGEIAMTNMPGTAPELFDFTVRSDSVAQVINSLMGSRVTLQYQQHRGVPGTCFGDTEYYVIGATKVAAP